MLVINNSLQPLTSGSLKEFEIQTGIQLPEEYKNFLLQHNGGFSPYNLFDHPHLDSEAITTSNLRRLLGIKPTIESSNDNTIEQALECYSYRNRIPRELLPIGNTGIGDVIGLVVEGKNTGKVYLWKHSYETEEDEEPDYSNIILIADSFNEFLGKLYSDT